MARTRKEPESINAMAMMADDNIESFDIEGEEGEAVSDSEDPARPKPRRRRARREPSLSMKTEISNEDEPKTIEASQENDMKETKEIENEQTTENEVEAATENETEVKADAVETNEEKPKRAPRKSRAKAAAETEDTDTKVETKTDKDVPGTVDETLSTVIKQWNNIEELSKSMATNFERVATTLQDLQNNHLTLMQESAKPKYAKLSFIQKSAMGASALAVVIAFVGLALAQSARQSAVDAFALSKVPAGTFNVSTRAPRPDSFTPSNARTSSDFAVAPRRESALNFQKPKKNKR